MPEHLHHPVVGLKLSQAFSQLLRGNGGFLAPCPSPNPSLLGDEPAFAGQSLRRKFPFPAQGGDRFDDWVVGHQFESNYLHHPVLPNRRSPGRLQRGRFCGDFRRYHSALSVSGDTCGLSGRFLACRLCIQKFRSPRQGFHGRYLSAAGNMGVLGGQNRRFEPGP